MKLKTRKEIITYTITSIIIWMIGLLGGLYTGQFTTSESDWMGLGFLFGLVCFYTPCYLLALFVLSKSFEIKKDKSFWIFYIMTSIILFSPLLGFGFNLLKHISKLIKT